MTDELESMRAENRALKVTNALEREATRRGVRNPAVAARAASRSGTSVNDQGEVVGVAEAITSLLREAPELASPASPGGGTPRRDYERPLGGGPGGRGFREVDPHAEALKLGGIS